MINMPLTATEQSRRDELIQTVKAGVLNVGVALRELRDSKLYLSTHKKWEDFCQDTFGCGGRWGYYLIQAANTIESLPPEQAEKITTEGAARAVHLSAKNEPKKEEDSNLLSDNISSKSDAQTVENQQNGVNNCSRLYLTENVKKSDKPVQKPYVFRYDETDYQIPPKLVSFWDKRDDLSRDWINRLRQLKKEIKDAKEGNDPMLAPFVTQAAWISLDDCIAYIHELVPYAVCYTCQGQNTADCRACKGCGFIGKAAFQRVPQELVYVRANANRRPK
jgi:hypothetical protein